MQKKVQLDLAMQNACVLIFQAVRCSKDSRYQVRFPWLGVSTGELWYLYIYFRYKYRNRLQKGGGKWGREVLLNQMELLWCCGLLDHSSIGSLCLHWNCRNADKIKLEWDCDPSLGPLQWVGALTPDRPVLERSPPAVESPAPGPERQPTQTGPPELTDAELLQ